VKMLPHALAQVGFTVRRVDKETASESPEFQ
jgi:hypothetical protein